MPSASFAAGVERHLRAEEQEVPGLDRLRFVAGLLRSPGGFYCLSGNRRIAGQQGQRDLHATAAGSHPHIRSNDPSRRIVGELLAPDAIHGRKITGMANVNIRFDTLLQRCAGKIGKSGEFLEHGPGLLFDR